MYLSVMSTTDEDVMWREKRKEKKERQGEIYSNRDVRLASHNEFLQLLQDHRLIC